MRTLRISARGVGKQFSRSGPVRDGLLRDLIGDGLRGLVGRDGRAQRQDAALFWALRDISFDIEAGEVIGLIGRNGAGKSSLLKLLSRITPPTTGSIDIWGRVGSLLEVGTGFHPELSGRENVYFNGLILGMGRAEVARKFDEIVAFAGVEEFIDMQVKHFSTGMQTRLGFAVAAHLEPEIMIVDEVLAVGDAEFQKRCLGKMQEVAGHGRTVVFVSHNMNAIQQLCSRAILLERGRIACDSSDVREVTLRYLFNQDELGIAARWDRPEGFYADPHFDLAEFFVGDADGTVLHGPAANDRPLFVHVRGNVRDRLPNLRIGYAIQSEDGLLLYTTLTTDAAEEHHPRLEPGDCRLRAPVPPRLLNEGNYQVEFIAQLRAGEWLYQQGTNAPSVAFTIQGGLSDSPDWIARRPGTLAPVLPWHKY
jgi:lipopolysaccharide transport system ATP-binding protein